MTPRPSPILRQAARVVRAAPAIAEAVVVVTAVEIGLRTLRLPALARWCGLVFDPAGPGPDGGGATQGLGLGPWTTRRLRAGLAVLRHGPFPDTCLRRALVMGSVLRARGPRLVVGVLRHDGELLAHAWVVVDGVSLDPMSSRAYRPLVAAVAP